MHCVYATSGWGIHDERWMSALRELAFDPTPVSRDGMSAQEFRDAVLKVAVGAAFVLAGPLDSVARHLRTRQVPVVGLSWGFDVPALADLGWLSELHAVVVDSSANFRAVKAAGLPPERIAQLPWGVDLARFTVQGPTSRPPGVPDDARILLSLRAHEPIYRVEDVIVAFAELRKSQSDVHLVLGHSGSQTRALREQVKALGLEGEAHFIGSVPEGNLPALLRATDCYISASEVDGTSVTLLQAMACGAPVVASDIDGNRDWIEDDVTGYLFEVGNRREAMRAISMSLGNPATAVTARRRVEDHADWAANLGRLRHLLPS